MTCKSFKILVSGLNINGEIFYSFVEELVTSIKKAKQEILILNYLINDKFIFEHIKSKLVYQPIKIFILTSEYTLKEKSNLLKLTGEFPKFFKIKTYRKTLLHGKLLIIDNNIAILGSHNITYSGLHKNIELSLLIEEKNIVKEFRNLFFILWNQI